MLNGKLEKYTPGDCISLNTKADKTNPRCWRCPLWLTGETSLTTTPSSSSVWPPSQPWRKWKIPAHLCSLWRSRPTSPRSNRLWRSSMTLTWPRSMSWSGLMETRSICSTGFCLWCFGCCQQNWDHLNLSPSQLILNIHFFHHKKIPPQTKPSGSLGVRCGWCGLLRLAGLRVSVEGPEERRKPGHQAHVEKLGSKPRHGWSQRVLTQSARVPVRTRTTRVLGLCSSLGHSSFLSSFRIVSILLLKATWFLYCFLLLLDATDTNNHLCLGHERWCVSMWTLLSWIQQVHGATVPSHILPRPSRPGLGTGQRPFKMVLFSFLIILLLKSFNALVYWSAEAKLCCGNKHSPNLGSGRR